MPEEKYFNFALLRILYLFIKFFLNPFVDISLTFFDSLFNSYWTSAFFALFKVTFHLDLLVYHQKNFYEISNINFAC